MKKKPKAERDLIDHADWALFEQNPEMLLLLADDIPQQLIATPRPCMIRPLDAWAVKHLLGNESNFITCEVGEITHDRESDLPTCRGHVFGQVMVRVGLCTHYLVTFP